METALTTRDDLSRIIELVTNSLESQHSKRAYQAAIEEFLGWYAERGKPGLNKDTVNGWKAALVERGLSAASVNLKLAAVRKLAFEAAENAALDQQTAGAIGRVRCVKAQGVRIGNWLTHDQAQQILDLCDTTTLIGKRDQAILAVLLGCGLRRSEMASLEVGQIQQREARWVIVDLRGKGGRVRSVPIPTWTMVCIDRWLAAAGISSGKVFRRIRRGDHLAGEGISPQAIRDLAAAYGERIGVDLAAHDLRRTFAKLARSEGAAIDQIQFTLGHSSVSTTERYLGMSQNLQHSPGDFLHFST